MNCEHALRNLAFSCRPVGEGVVFVTSPFSIDGDGERVGAYVIERGDGMVKVSDNCATLMNLASRGVNVVAGKLRSVKALAVGLAEIHDSGEIAAHTARGNASLAVADVCATAVAVAGKGSEWLRVSKQSDFEERVGAVLDQSLHDRLRRRVKIFGASGRQIEFPFLIDRDSSAFYVQPVAYGETHVPTENVYRGLGKMTELALLDVPIEQRIIVIEDVVDDPSVAQAMTLLSSAATVLPYTRSRDWVQRLAA